MRIDKLLANSGYGTRKEVKQLIASGIVFVNQQVELKIGRNVNPETDLIQVGDDIVKYQQFHYYIMNKPEGIISATEDLRHETVIDWLGPEYAHLQLFPVGRLDIDTTGLLLLTNNGQLAHKLLSPKRHVSKRYEAVIEGVVPNEAIEWFKKGLNLGDFVTLPAELEILFADVKNNQTRIEIVIQEGKFHQVKRMFEKINCKVIQLHRLSMGPIVLPDDLQIGEFRALNEEEWQLLEPFGIE